MKRASKKTAEKIAEMDQRAGNFIAERPTFGWSLVVVLLVAMIKVGQVILAFDPGIGVLNP